MAKLLQAVLQDAGSDPVFLIGSFVAIVAAIGMVTRRNPVYSALWLLLTFLAVAVVFLKLNAPFLAAIHVLVYTGAILVLFLFVIMLLNLQKHELGSEPSRGAKFALAGISLALLGGIGFCIVQGLEDPMPFRDIRPVVMETPTGDQAISAANWGGVEHVGYDVFARFVVPFEIVSILIIVAILGAVVLAKRKI